jgi:hypothetical protein
MSRKSLTSLVLVFIIFFYMMIGGVKADISEDQVKMTVTASPEREFNQFESGAKCSFSVDIENLGLQVKQGDVVNETNTDERYSGNFTVESTIYLRKEGRLSYGSQSTAYIYFLNNTIQDEYQSLAIPPINGTTNTFFRYNLTKGYEILGVRPDENLVLYQKVNLYVQTYSVSEGIDKLHVGRKIASYKATYYVIDAVKREYIKGKFQDIRYEISLLNMVNSEQVQINKAYYENILDAINSTIVNGDYVTALDKISNYYQFDQPVLTDLLYINLNSTGSMADQYIILKNDNNLLEANYNQLQIDFTNIYNVYKLKAAEVEQLNVKLGSLKQNSYLLFGLSASIMFSLGYLIGRRAWNQIHR